MIEMQKLYLLVPMAPLAGALIAGLFGPPDWYDLESSRHYCIDVRMCGCVYYRFRGCFKG